MTVFNASSSQSLDQLQVSTHIEATAKNTISDDNKLSVISSAADNAPTARSQNNASLTLTAPSLPATKQTTTQTGSSKLESALVAPQETTLSPEQEAFKKSHAYKMFQLEQTLGTLEGTTEKLTQTLEDVATNRKAESEAIKKTVAEIDKTSQEANQQLANLSSAAKSLGYHALKMTAYAGSAIGSLMLASSLAKDYVSDTTISRSLASSAFGLMSLAAYQIYTSSELSQVSQAGKGLLNSLTNMSTAGKSLFDNVSNTGAEILKDVGNIAEVASEASSVANKAIKDVKGASL